MTEISNLSHSYSRLDMFAKCPKRYYHQVIAKDVKDKTFDATAVGIRIHESMDNRLSVETPLISEAEKYEPLCRNVEQAEGYSQKLYEKELTIDVYGNAVGWFDDDAWMRAKLDVLLIGDTHPTTILDWKTGRRRPQYMTFDQLGAQRCHGMGDIPGGGPDQCGLRLAEGRHDGPPERIESEGPLRHVLGEVHDTDRADRASSVG